MACQNALIVRCFMFAALFGCQGEQASGKIAQAPEVPAPVAASLPPAKIPDGLVLEVEPMEGRYRLHIQNRGALPVNFAARLSLERKNEAGFEPVSGQRLAVIGTCDTAPDPCLTLAPGAERVPLPVSLSAGDMQCQDKGVDLPMGEYRVVLHGCAGDAFALASASLPSAPR